MSLIAFALPLVSRTSISALRTQRSLIHLHALINLHALRDEYRTAPCGSYNMEHSPFASLPAEIRNQIYSMALLSPQKMILDFEFLEEHSHLRIGGPRHLLALTETCRQIRSEILPLFYSNRDFVVLNGNLKWTADTKNVKSARSKEPLRLFRDWLRTIGFESARSIRTVEVYAHVLPHEGTRRHIVYAMTLLSSVVRFSFLTGKSCSSGRIRRCGGTLTYRS